MRTPSHRLALAEADAPNYRAAADGMCMACQSMEAGECARYGFEVKAGYGCDSFVERAAMAAPMLYSDGVDFVQVGDREADGSVWNEVIRVGTFTSKNPGGAAASGQDKVEIDEKWIDSLVRGTGKVLAEGWYPGGIPVRNDPTHKDKSKEAVGRIHEVRKGRASDGTVRALARIEWTDPNFADSVRKKHVSGLSLEARNDHQSKTADGPIGDWTLTAVVPTNDPFIPGMEALAASEAGSSLETESMKLIAQALNLGEGASEAAMVSEATRVVKLAEEAKRAKAELAEATTKLEVLEAADKRQRDEIVALTERLSEHDKARDQRILDEALESNRIDATDDAKAEYLKAVATFSEDWARERYPARGGGSMAGHGGDDARREPVGASTPTQAAALAATEEVAKLEKSLVESGQYSPAAAYGEAYRRVAADPKKAAALQSAEA